MKLPDRDHRLFRGSRGRILVLLNQSERTVNELAEALQLTDNTVRAHLATLEQDGFVQQKGLRRGVRKPHYAYHLTPVAEQLFLNACDPFLENLLNVLAAQLAPEAFIALLREAGRCMAEKYRPDLQGVELAQRMEKAMELLQDLGGVAELEERAGNYFIRGYRCPLAAVVADHPRVCEFVERLLTDVINAPVRERCGQSKPPRCHFEILVNNTP